MLNFFCVGMAVGALLGDGWADVWVTGLLFLAFEMLLTAALN